MTYVIKKTAAPSVVDGLMKPGRHIPPKTERVGDSSVASKPAASRTSGMEKKRTKDDSDKGGGAGVSDKGILQMQEAIKVFADHVTANDKIETVQHFRKYMEDAVLEEKAPSRTTEPGTLLEPTLTKPNIFESFRAIHLPKPTEKKFKIDGDWGPSTNDALNDLEAFGEGLFSVAATFRYTPKYDQQAFSNFGAHIPKNHDELKALPQATKVKYAPIFTTHIKALQGMYDELLENVGGNIENQAYMSGTGKVTQYKAQTPQDKQKRAAIEDLKKNQERSQYAKTWYIIPSPRGDTNTYSFNLSHITNQDAFNKWKLANKLTDIPPQTLLDLMRNAQMSAMPTG